MRRGFVVGAFAASLAFAGTAPDLRVTAGEPATGDVVFEGEEDRIAVDLLEGMKLTFTAKPAKKSPLRCDGDLLAPDGTVVAVPPKQKKLAKGAVTLSGVLAPATGTYFVAVRGTSEGPLGTYDLTTKAAAPPKLPKVTATVLAGSTQDVEFDAVAGMVVNVTVTASKGTALRPHVEAIVGPGGEEIDLTAPPVKVKETATKATVSKVTIPSFGTWALRVGGAGGTGGGFSATITRALPKAPKARRDLRGASGGEAAAGTPQAIDLLPGSAALAAGATTAFVARGTWADGRTRDLTRVVEWSTGNRNAAAVAAGVVTGVGAGGTTLQAWTGGVEATEALVLVGGATVSGVQVVPAGATLLLGDAARLQAVATLDGASAAAATVDVTRAATWEQTGTALSAVAGGRVVASQLGTSQVTAAVGGSTSAQAAVEVPARRLVRLTLSPAYAELTQASPSRTFVATATYSDGVSVVVTPQCTFASDNLAAATMSGATATRVANGTAGVRAVLDGVASRPAVLNVGPVALSSLEVEVPATVAAGATAQATATGRFADGGARDVTDCVTWTSGTPATATVSAAQGTRGLVTGVAESGTAVTIAGTLTAGGATRSDNGPLTCTAPAVRSLAIVPATASVAVAGTVPLTVRGTRTDGSVFDATAAAAWTTSDATVATVSGGVVTGVGDGGVSVTATLDGVAARSLAVVGTGRLTGVALDAGGAAVVGDSATLTARATFEPASAAAPLDVTERLFLDDPLVAAVAAATLTARRSQSAEVTLAAGGLASGAVAFDGAAPVVRSLLVFPQTAYVTFVADTQLAAQARRSDGLVTDEAANVGWTSLSPQFVTVSTTGLAQTVAKGVATVRANLVSPALQADGTVEVLGDAPSVSNVSPGTVLRGQSGVTFTIDGTALDGPGAQVTLSGSGVTIVSGPTVTAGGTQATIVADVAANAATGARDLTYTTAVGSSTRTSAFSVVVPAPSFSSVSPTNVDVPTSGSTQQTLTVTGTDFVTGDDFVVESHAGVTLGAVTLVNSTTMTATLTVASTAARARLDVTVRQSAANGGATIARTDALKIGPPDPSVTSVTPDHFLPGQAATRVRVVGTNFSTSMTVEFPGQATGGYSTTSVSVTDNPGATPDEISFTITVGQTAGFSTQDLRLTNPSDVAYTRSAAFAIVPRDPTVTSLSVATVARGASGVPVTVKGTNFRSGARLSASGAGVTFSSVTVVDPQTVTATVAATSGATLGARDVTLSHATSEGGRGATRAGALTVVSASPTVASVAPGTVGRTASGGATRRVAIRVTGTNFSGGATLALTRSGGSGLTVVTGTTTVASSTELLAEVDVAGGTTTGAWDVRVTNPSGVGDSGTSGNGALTVVSETTLAVNRVVPGTGSAAGGERVTVYGSGFVRGCRVEFGAEKAGNVQLVDQNTLLCTVPPPANPSSSTATTLSQTAPTHVDVKVTNNPGGSASNATLTRGYAYEADAGPFLIVQSHPAESSTGNKRNLKSAVLRLSAPANTNTVTWYPNSGSFQTGTQCGWFEGGGFLTSSQTGGFGADRRFLVFSRTGTGNLPINNAGDYILDTATALKSASGRALTPSVLQSSGNHDQWSFTLSSSTTDSTAPSITARSPGSSATGVATTVQPSVTFGEEIDPLTVTTSTVQLLQSGTPLNCRVTLSDDIRTLLLTPTEELAANTTYTVSLASTVADLCGNALSATTWTFTTASSDTAAPTMDGVVLEDLPSSVDGSGTYVAGRDSDASAGSSTAYDAYLPRHGWTVVVRFSDGGSGIDPTSFSARANTSVGSSSANTELASKFTVTPAQATWTVASSDAFTAGDDVTLTFQVRDVAGNGPASTSITFDVVDIDTTVAAAAGGDHDPFDTQDVWVLRFDRDVYTATIGSTGSAPNGTVTCTTTGSSNGVPDVEEALQLCGLRSTNMTTDAANCVNGSSVGTNAIVLRLFQERLRASLRARFGIGEDGTRGADAANVDLLLPGEQGALTSMPTWSTTSTGTSANAYSEMEIGGDTQTNSSPTSYYGTIGYAYLDPRNGSRQANLNAGSASFSNNNGIFCINMFKSLANVSRTGTDWGAAVLSKFVTAKGGTPVGENSVDDDVLAGAFDRSSVSNSQTQNDRYDAIMDAIEMAAHSVSGTTAHEMGHSIGLVADGAPKTGLFGWARRENAFTEATSSAPNTSGHLDFVGNDVMAPASSIDDRVASGTDFQLFSPLDRNYLLHRQVHDEGR